MRQAMMWNVGTCRRVVTIQGPRENRKRKPLKRESIDIRGTGADQLVVAPKFL